MVVAEQCDLSVEAVKAFYALFASTEKVVSVFSQGVNQSLSGSGKGNALINCHLLTGKTGKPGMGHAQQFPYNISLDAFREHAKLSGHKNEGERCFNISPLADLTVEEFDALQPSNGH